MITAKRGRHAHLTVISSCVMFPTLLFQPATQPASAWLTESISSCVTREGAFCVSLALSATEQLTAHSTIDRIVQVDIVSKRRRYLPRVSATSFSLRRSKKNPVRLKHTHTHVHFHDSFLIHTHTYVYSRLVVHAESRTITHQPLTMADSFEERDFGLLF